jgi:hypothetical protein
MQTEAAVRKGPESPAALLPWPHSGSRFAKVRSVSWLEAMLNALAASHKALISCSGCAFTHTEVRSSRSKLAVSANYKEVMK